MKITIKFSSGKIVRWDISTQSVDAILETVHFLAALTVVLLAIWIFT